MKKIICIIEIFILCFILCGCNGEERRIVEEKIDSEIEYIEDVIFVISNKLIKKEYNDESNVIDWGKIKQDAQKINNSWTTLELDFAQINIDNEKIMYCSNKINDMLLSISVKNEVNLLEDIQKLYEYLGDVKNEYTEDKNSVKKMKLKAKVLEIYYYVYQNNFDVAIQKMTELKKYYETLMNDESYSDENRYNLSKVSLLIEEYDVALQTKNIDLIEIKYINLIEKI